MVEDYYMLYAQFKFRWFF